MTKEFATIAELVQDPIFVNFVNEELSEMKSKRFKRPDPKPGYHYVRDWFDRMQSEEQLTAEYFISNIEAIWNKTSPLSSVIRIAIDRACTSALYKTHNYYQDIPDPAEVKPKKTRGKKALVVDQRYEAAE